MFPSPFARRFGMVSAPFATNNTVTKGTKLPESRTVIRKLSFAPRSRTALSLTIAAQFLRCQGNALLWFQRCVFWTVESLFSSTAVAQNMLALHYRLERFDYLDFLPKRPQGTTKILGTPALAGTKTPAAPKVRAKGATTDCAETPVNCPYISGPRAARTAGGWPTKHLPAGRRAGRSDWAERRFRRQPFILLSFSSSKKARKAQETQSYRRF